MAHPNWAWVAMGLAVGAAWLAPAQAAGGKPVAARTAKAKVTVNVPALTAKLKSSDADTQTEALQEAGAAGKGAAPLARPIEELLARGTSSEVGGLALTTLAKIGGAASADAIVPYARHRDPELRKKALMAMVKTGSGSTVGALRLALTDPDPGVRVVATSSLGTVKGREGIDDLFVALDHQVIEAAAAIGEMCVPDECEKLAGRTGVFGLDVMTTGFDQILFRPASEIPDDAKIKIVARVRELGTQEANKYLRDVQSRWTPPNSPKVRQALEQAVLATSGSR